jgi:hypothetical protein
MNDTSNKYCIVGAGPSGLAMAAEFKRRNIPYDHFERQSRLGGVWEIENPGTPMYQSAHLISSKSKSGFWDFPMPADYPDYPKHTQVLDYLKSYAGHHQLESAIQFAAEVQNIEPSEHSAQVTVGGQTYTYRGVVCASGCNWEPHLPDIPGDFSGELRHALSYRNASEFEGKRVLIVGLGNSGADIACDAARVAERAVISVRRGYHFVPKHIFGMPSDVFASEGPHLPLWLEGPIFSALLRLIMGDMRRLGMPKPDHGLLQTHPILNDQLVHHLRHGDVSIQGDIKSLHGSMVEFVDGSSAEFDLIVFATGYTRRIAYLDAKYLDPGHWAAAQFLTCFSRKYESLYTLGFIEVNGALFPAVSRLATLIAELAQTRNESNERASQFFEWVRSTEFDLSGGRHLVASRRHAHYCDDYALNKAIARAFEQLGVSMPKSVTAEKKRLTSGR